jgi:hypothetical protein
MSQPTIDEGYVTTKDDSPGTVSEKENIKDSVLIKEITRN